MTMEARLSKTDVYAIEIVASTFRKSRGYLGHNIWFVSSSSDYMVGLSPKSWLSAGKVLRGRSKRQ